MKKKCLSIIFGMKLNAVKDIINKWYTAREGKLKQKIISEK